MKGLGRNLIYWGANLEKITMMMIVWVLFIIGLMTYMEGGNFQEEMARMIPNYLSILICVSAFMNALNGVNNFFSFTISLGSTRKASFTAMQIVQHLIMLQYILLGGVIYYFIQPEVFAVLSEFILTILGAVLVLMALANIASLVSVKFGRIAGVIVYVIIFLAIIAGLVVGILSGVLDNNNFVFILASFAHKPYIFGVGVILDAIAIGVFYAIMKKSNLQF